MGDYSCGCADRSEEQSFPAGTGDGWQRTGWGRGVVTHVPCSGRAGQGQRVTTARLSCSMIINNNSVQKAPSCYFGYHRWSVKVTQAANGRAWCQWCLGPQLCPLGHWELWGALQRGWIWRGGLGGASRSRLCGGSRRTGGMAWLGCSRNCGSETACLLTALTAESPRCLEVLSYQDEAPDLQDRWHSALGLVPGSSISFQTGQQSPPWAQASIALAAGISCPLVGPSVENRRGFLVKQTPLGAPISSSLTAHLGGSFCGCELRGVPSPAICVSFTHCLGHGRNPVYRSQGLAC